MTRNSFENIMPDSLTGALFSVEGLEKSVVILNGPTGCKFYHSAISDYQFPRGASFDPLMFPEVFYFGQPRIPCTYLDSHDYVYGSGDKLENIMREIKDRGYQFLAVINSPGAALIGDDLDHFIKDSGVPLAFSMESTGFSGEFGEGFQRGVIKVLETLGDIPREDKIPHSVNLVGISIFEKFYAGDIIELKRLLRLCGVEVISSMLAGESIHSLSRAGRASLNVLLYPEYGLEVAKWLEAKFHIPYYLSHEGLPLGFSATEDFLRRICEILKCDPAPALADLERKRALAWLHLSRFSSRTGFPGGAEFGATGAASYLLPLTKWLVEYMGMIPVAIKPIPGSNEDFSRKLRAFLEERGFGSSYGASLEETPLKILFADGNNIAAKQSGGHKFTGIEISLPTLGYIDIVPKTFMGGEGALKIIERIINGLQFSF